MTTGGERIGVDESGKGDFFGPLAVAACWVGPEETARLAGVTDSKKLSDPMAIRLAEAIRSLCPHRVVVLMPEEYNARYGRLKNLNHLLAELHAEVIESVLEQRAAPLIISDEFAKGGLEVRKRLGERGRGATFRSVVRAEADLAVAAASVLARAAFLEGLAEAGRPFAVSLPKGATNVIGPGRALVRTFGPSALPKVAKMHFKTSAQVLAP